MSRDRSNGVALTGSESKVAVRIASGASELRAALRLVHDAYVHCGLIDPNEFGVRVTPYHLLPTTEVFVGVIREEIACTVSLVRDGRFGLPMEAIYAEEVQRCRDRGIAVAEASCLADQRQSLARSFPLLARLMSFTIQCAGYRGVDELLIAVHPRHGRFYERYLGFRQIGGEKSYGAVRDNPAVALALDIPRLAMDHPAAHHRVFRVSFREEDFEYRRIPDDVRAEWRGMVDVTRVPAHSVDGGSCLCKAERICA